MEDMSQDIIFTGSRTTDPQLPVLPACSDDASIHDHFPIPEPQDQAFWTFR